MSRPHRRRAAVAAVWLSSAVAAAVAAPSTTTVPTPPDFSADAQSVHVPFAHMTARTTRPGTGPATDAAAPAVNFDHLTGMNVRISVNGGPPVRVLVDTGSVGIILGASDVPRIDPDAPPGEMVYSSSGNGFYGVWTPSTVTFVDAKGPDGRPVTAELPVMAAREYRQTPGTVNGGITTRPVNHNPHVYMCGVGFGRGKDPHPERNPFLNLTAMRAGTMRRGYAITRDGYTLGLSADAVGAGYFYQKLRGRAVSDEARQLAPGLKDWETSRGWIVVNGRREPEVPILIDTGLTNFMIPSPGLDANTELPRGTRVEVDLLGGQLRYSFTSAEAKDPPSRDPVVPLKVTRFPTTNPAANVNTGLRTLAVYDYLYDADGGYLGLRPTARHR